MNNSKFKIQDSKLIGMKVGSNNFESSNFESFNRYRKAFSLVELLVVITIIAILSVVAYTAVGGQTVKARNSRRMQDISTIQSALEAYFVENGEYPASTQLDPASEPHENFYTYDWTILDKKYISKQPLDPWGMPYAYQENKTNGGETKAFEYQLAATIETDTGYEAYVVGNGTDLIEDAAAAIVTDGGAILPYEKPAAE